MRDDRQQLAGRRGGAARRAGVVGGIAALAMGFLPGLPVAAAAAGSGSGPVVVRPDRPAGPEAVSLARARATGRPVIVAAATTVSSTLAADPGGSFTVTESLFPVRKRVGGVWRGLDATLRRDRDGRVSAAVTTDGLSLSGGGRGPLATISSGGRFLSLSLPFALPVPVLSGATATYRSVLPGVDLQVTADVQGGYSEVLIVRDAAAAASPVLRGLVMATTTRGVTVRRAGRGGGLVAADAAGAAVFTSPAPVMWDSAVASGRAVIRRVGVLADARSGLPAASSAAGPGERARTARLRVTLKPGRVILVPSVAMLTSAATRWPVYIDPGWTPPSAGASMGNYAEITNIFTPYYDTLPAGQTLLQVGDQGWSSPFFTARSYYDMRVPTQIYGAHILGALMDITEEVAPSCTATPVSLYNTAWFDKTIAWPGPALLTNLDTENAAHGYTNCAAAGITFQSATMTSFWQGVANGRSATTEYFGLLAGNEGDPYGWKQFALNPTLSISYDHGPNAPAGLTTSPPTACSSSPSSFAGDGPVSLYAQVSHPDAGADLFATFRLWKTGDTTQTPIAGSGTEQPGAYSSGSVATFIAPQAALEAAAGNPPGPVPLSWNVTVSDHVAGIPAVTSGTCTFTFDPTRPGKPGISPTPQPGSTFGQIGQPLTLSLSPGTTGGTPAKYAWQLNSAAPHIVTADPSTGDATITITPNRVSDTLTVYAISAGGNYSQDAGGFPFTPALGTAQADGDLTGDGIPDLVLPGGQDNLSPGLWLAAGQGAGQVSTSPANIGVYGTTTGGGPADFTGTQAITGLFSPNDNYTLQGILDYNPAAAGSVQGEILYGNGDGSALNPVSGATANVTGLTDAGTGTGETTPQPVLQVANAGTIGNNSSVTAAGPWLFGTGADGKLYLFGAPVVGQYQNAATAVSEDITATKSPDGSLDWNSWTITTCQLPGGTAMYLWNKTTGALYLWENLALNSAGSDLSYTPYTVATSGWNTGAALTLQAANINGAPDLRATGPGTGQQATTTAYLATISGTTITLTPGTPQPLATPDHTWQLNDPNTQGTAVSTAADQPGTGDTPLTLTGHGGVTWNTGDPIYSPDVAFDGTTGYLATAAATAAFIPDTSFTVSAWVNPAALGGTVFAQDGTSYSSVIVSSTTSGQWSMAINTGGTNAASYITATGGTAVPGLWTHLTLTYDSPAHLLDLYDGGTQIATLIDTTPPTIQGSFRLGASQANSAAASFYHGQIADTQTWNSLANQPALPAYNPVGAVRVLDTRYGTGGYTAPVGPNTTISLQVTGTSVVPATGVTAVVLNLTATDATASSYVTAYQDGQSRPGTSNLNFNAGETIANLIVVPVGSNGRVDFWNGSGSVDLIADLQGYYSTTGGLPYVPLGASRVLDTRYGTGGYTTPVPAGGTISLQVGPASPKPLIPITYRAAVVLNLTATDPTAAGNITVYADGTTRPNPASNLNFSAGQTIANLVVVPVGGDGKIDFYNSSVGTVDLIGDLEGYYPVTATAGGPSFDIAGPVRVMNTSAGIGWSGPVLSGGTISLQVSGVDGVPAIGVTAVVLNVTSVSPTAASYITVFPDGTTRPATSNLQFAAWQDTAELVVVPVGADGKVEFYNAAGTTNLIADLQGYYMSS